MSIFTEHILGMGVCVSVCAIDNGRRHLKCTSYCFIERENLWELYSEHIIACFVWVRCVYNIHMNIRVVIRCTDICIYLYYIHWKAQRMSTFVCLVFYLFSYDDDDDDDDVVQCATCSLYNVRMNTKLFTPLNKKYL